MRRVAVTFVFVITACSSSGSGEPIVTEPVQYFELNLTTAGTDLAAAAPAYILASDGVDLADGDDLTPLATVAGPDGLRHARLQQVFDGVPVFGSEIIAHADESTFLGYNGFLTRGLDGFDTTPALGASDAIAIAAADRGAGITFARQDSRLVILPGRDGLGADLVWQIELANEPQDAADLGRWFYFVAADDGALLWKYDGLATLEQASGPGGNARVARSWNAALDVEKEGGEYLMKTARQVTLDMKTKMDGGDPAHAAALDGFMDPNVNDAHGFTEITLDMMRDWTGNNSIDGAGFVITARVHYGKNVDVASWDGTFVNFGDSNPDMRYPRPGALDIVGHEINHGFTEKHSHLVYAEQSGGLNESFSDVAGTMAEFYREGDTADFNIGEDIYVAADGVHRFMCNPAAKGSLDHMSEYERGAEVHSSSGIGNRAFCLSVARFKAQNGGSTVDAVRRVGLAWYAANAAYWTSTATYTQACQGTVDGARSLGYSKEEVAQINQSWADVGVHCDGAPVVCDEDDTCEPSVGETCSSCAADCDACSQDCGWFKKMKCKIGIGDCSRCDLPAGCGDGVCAEDEDDESCAQDCGCAAPGDTCGSVAPYGCYCDAVCGVRGDCCADRDDVCGED
jgi:vibriolysin